MSKDATSIDMAKKRRRTIKVPTLCGTITFRQAVATARKLKRRGKQ